MSKIFKNYEINLEEGTVYSLHFNRFLGKKKNGYHSCKCYDIFGNEYHFIHLVIMAEALQLPIDKWPKDEKGRRYEVDHIIQVSKGGTDSISNLRLVSKLDNARNENTIKNRKEITIGEGNPFYGKHHSEETKKILSEQRKGKPSPRKGKHHTDEAIKKMSESHKGLPSHAAKRVDQIDMISGEVVQQWESAAEAEEKGGFSQKKISACCCGYKKYRSHKKYYWKRPINTLDFA